APASPLTSSARHLQPELMDAPLPCPGHLPPPRLPGGPASRARPPRTAHAPGPGTHPAGAAVVVQPDCARVAAPGARRVVAREKDGPSPNRPQRGIDVPFAPPSALLDALVGRSGGAR